MKQLGKDSIRQMELMRFYMQHKQDPHGPNIALFVGNLPTGLSQRNYEQILNKYVTDENKFTSIGPIYYEYGSVVLTFEDSQKAVSCDFRSLFADRATDTCLPAGSRLLQSARNNYRGQEAAGTAAAKH